MVLETWQHEAVLPSCILKIQEIYKIAPWKLYSAEIICRWKWWPRNDYRKNNISLPLLLALGDTGEKYTYQGVTQIFITGINWQGTNIIHPVLNTDVIGL